MWSNDRGLEDSIHVDVRKRAQGYDHDSCDSRVYIKHHMLTAMSATKSACRLSNTLVHRHTYGRFSFLDQFFLNVLAKVKSSGS